MGSGTATISEWVKIPMAQYKSSENCYIFSLSYTIFFYSETLSYEDLQGQLNLALSGSGSGHSSNLNEPEYKLAIQNIDGLTKYNDDVEI